MRIKMRINTQTAFREHMASSRLREPFAPLRMSEPQPDVCYCLDAVDPVSGSHAQFQDLHFAFAPLVWREFL